MTSKSGKINEDSALAALTWTEVIKKLSLENNELSIKELSAANSLAQVTKENAASVVAMLNEFIMNPEMWLQGGQPNAMAVHENLIRARVKLDLMRDFVILYVAAGKNIQKMSLGAKSSERTKRAKVIVKGLNLKTTNNQVGYQTETVAIALGYFMQTFRVEMGAKGLLPSIDKDAEMTTTLPVRWRWLGSIVCFPFGLVPESLESDAKFILDYESWINEYIKRRRKDPLAQEPAAAAARRAVNRTFYCTLASIYAKEIKLKWASGIFEFAMPGASKDLDAWKAISKKVDFVCYREQDGK